MSPAVRELRSALDRLADQGRRVDLWWRDDDAVRDGPALRRLLALADDVGCPLALAVVPFAVEASLVDALADRGAVVVLPHGYRHRNHAPAGERKSEYPTSRALPDCLDEIRRARLLVTSLFGDKAVGVFVPPWNRLTSTLAPELTGLGYLGLSAFGGRSPQLAQGLWRLDTHLDPVDWPNGRSLVPPARIAEQLGRALTSGSAIGLLTHHLAFDRDLWEFCAEFTTMARAHPALRFRSVSDLLPAAEPSSQADSGLRKAGPAGVAELVS